jgi:glycosyltransferase involved in cell wall biosynthesis/putative flippase GtrA
MSIKRVGKFTIIGIILSLFNFLVYTFLARVIMNTNELLWLDSLIAYLIATILGYILHSKITWKERRPTKSSIIKFFLWNGITAILISPLLTWLFQKITPLDESIFNISNNINLPFDYNFIESTSVFILTTCVTMILNYLFYDKLVFGSNKTLPTNHKVEERSKVSIVVPIYNTAKYLKRCIDSILDQSYKNLEVILVDDGSTDDSGLVADDYAKKDSRIKMIHQKNAGQSSARNIGIKKATGEFISFIDSDDEIKPDFINDLLSAFTADTSLSVCGMHYKRLKAKTAEDVYINPIRSRRKKESKKAYILYLLAIDGRIYSSVNKLYRTNVVKKLQFDQSLNFAEDTKFVLDYLKKSNGGIAIVNEPLYVYNFGTETSTIRTVSTSWSNWQTSYSNLKNWLGPHPKIREKFWLHIVHLRWRISYIRSKRRAKQ